MTATITVNTTVPGMHYWRDATGRRAYLAQPHRHLFHIGVTVLVTHDDRQVEFHDLLDRVRAEAIALAEAPDEAMLNYGGRSCETLARQLMVALADLAVTSVSWSEDNEVTATVTP